MTTREDAYPYPGAYAHRRGQGESGQDGSYGQAHSQKDSEAYGNPQENRQSDKKTCGHACPHEGVYPGHAGYL